MRYLPLTEQDRAEMLARIGVARIDDLFADVPPERLARALPHLPRRRSEIEVERVLRGMADQNVAAGDRRPPDPALRIFDLVHAVSARDRPGHAAIPVRVPDPGGDTHRHGGGERLDV